MQIVLDTRGLHFSVRNKCFFIQTGSVNRIIHPSRIQSILVTAPCRISSPALILAAQSEIPVIICTPYGKPEVRMWSPRFMNISTLRRKQYGFTSSTLALSWANEIIQMKISGQISNLKYMADRKTSLMIHVQKGLLEIDSQLKIFNEKVSISGEILKKELLFIEAFTASRYWQTIGMKLPQPFTFTNRVKKNPGDQFNHGINYLYGMLRNQTESAILSIGLDPALGIVHRDGYKMPSLVFDLMEPFRPITDRLLFNSILENEILWDIPEQKAKIPVLTKPARKQLISLFNVALNSRIKFRNTVTTLQNHILTEAKYLSERIKHYE